VVYITLRRDVDARANVVGTRDTVGDSLAVAPLMPAWKADDVSDVGNAREVAHKPVESQAEPPMRHAAISSKIDIPLQGLF
jgi:hypothetical protein